MTPDELTGKTTKRQRRALFLYVVHTHGSVRSAQNNMDLLTFPWVGSTASIGHFWAAADAAGSVF